MCAPLLFVCAVTICVCWLFCVSMCAWLLLLCVFQYVLPNCGRGGWSSRAHLPCCAASQLDAPVHLPTSQFRSPFNHAKAYFHASVHSHLFVSCLRVPLSRKRKSPETLAKNTLTVPEYLSPESRAVNLFGKTASPSNFSCLECLP